jgi:hypothetical protein
MPIIKPEKVNGKVIGRPHVRLGDGIMTKLESSSVFYPPTVSVQYPHVPVGRLVEQEARAIVGMRAMTSDELAQRLYDFAKRVIENEKRRPADG